MYPTEIRKPGPMKPSILRHIWGERETRTEEKTVEKKRGRSKPVPVEEWFCFRVGRLGA
jgi:hypothetical protein